VSNKSSSNPFTDCRVVSDIALGRSDKWFVSSVFWTVPCVSEAAAKRLCEIIQGAYRAGENDLRSQLNALLSGGDSYES
jgi:hypothetical protein